jgi:hypothetical protein
MRSTGVTWTPIWSSWTPRSSFGRWWVAAITESAIAWIVEFKSGKVIRVREYLDPKKALEAVGLAD